MAAGGPHGDGDPFGLERFVAAQCCSYGAALAELRAGAKRGHWMWFVFPQVAGLGRSEMARRYAIASIAEARAYLAHPVLGARYRQCLAALDTLNGHTAGQLFGPVDAIKLRSSLTLFAAAGEGAASAVLRRWCGTPDPATLDRLAMS